MHRKLCAIALAVGAACAAPAFAEVVEVYTIPTGQDYYYVTPSYTTTDYYYVAPSTTYVAPTTTYYYAPATRTTYYTEPAITVEAPRYYNDDQRINADVVDAIAGDRRIRDGANIGVSTYRGNVQLSGRVTTPNQRDYAGEAANSVPGVDEVTNLIRPRVGGL
jgi:hypothetical protein